MAAPGGIKFAHYTLVRRIARGGMAEVFEARQRGLEGFDRRVAVKRILPHLADQADFVRMFLAEARLVARLAHPNIVHIYDFGKVDTDYFIAMEYVDGLHCGQLVKPAGAVISERLPPALVARIGADAANALHHAHELADDAGTPIGLVHRDVSPANIMVSFDGVVKLCDFGIAKLLTTTSQLTTPGELKGKYAYMSPEQTLGAPLDGRSDVFSLGICLWEWLAGAPLVPRDLVEAIRIIRDGTFPSIAQVVPTIPPPLARAVGWALEIDRERRATATQLAQALEAFIKSSPDLAGPMQLAAWIRPRFARTPSAVVPVEGDRTPPAVTPPAATPASASPTSSPFDDETTLRPGSVIELPTSEEATLAIATNPFAALVTATETTMLHATDEEETTLAAIAAPAPQTPFDLDETILREPAPPIRASGPRIAPLPPPFPISAGRPVVVPIPRPPAAEEPGRAVWILAILVAVGIITAAIIAGVQ